MATLREIRKRIGSIKSTQQITRAMKMVAAAKLRRAQENILAARPYAFQIDEMIRHLLATVSDTNDPLLEVRPVQHVTLVAITADRGLCGAFNSSINRRVIRQFNLHTDKEVSLVCLGRKSAEFFTKRNYPVEKRFTQFFNNLEFDHAVMISDYLVEQFRQKKTDLIEIVYNEFKNAVQQTVIVEKFLPLSREEFSSEKLNLDYIYEPGKEQLLQALLPRHLKMQVWRMLLESNASEQGARMTAMENATDNATELIHDLTLHYNRVRQAAITKEISEIVGGAEALRSAD